MKYLFHHFSSLAKETEIYIMHKPVSGMAVIAQVRWMMDCSINMRRHEYNLMYPSVQT